MFGVAFLSPLFLIGALAAAVPIALHLFRRRTEVVIDFPSVRLLTRAPVQQHRSRRLRELILLALRVAALVLLAVSFARPYVARAIASVTAPITVVAVDTSLSLSAPGQMTQARAAAKQAVQAAPGSHAVALVSFADAATVVVPATTDRGAVLAAIDGLQAGPGGTRYRTAFARAAELIGDRDGHVVTITDVQQAGWEANDDGGLPQGVTSDVKVIPPPRGNLAVTFADRREGAVVATVQNYGADAVRAPVHLVVNGTSVANAEVQVAALAAVDVRLAADLPSSGAASVVVDDAVGYQGDNVRYLVLDPPPALSLAVIVADPAGTTSGMYVERALSVAGRGREFAADVVDGRLVASWSAEDLARRDAIVLIGTRTWIAGAATCCGATSKAAGRCS